MTELCATCHRRPADENHSCIKELLATIHTQDLLLEKIKVLADRHFRWATAGIPQPEAYLRTIQSKVEQYFKDRAPEGREK